MESPCWCERAWCLTSGERRVQLLVEEPVLPVLLLLSDIAPFRPDSAQHGADLCYSADDDKKNKHVFIEHA